MQYLNKHIEALSKKKNKSLIRRQISCGLFQELKNPLNEGKEFDKSPKI